MDAIETLYPSDKIICYMRMSERTRLSLLRRLNAQQIKRDNLSTDQLMAVNFASVQLYIDPSLDLGVIDGYNAKGELIQRSKIGTDFPEVSFIGGASAS